MRRVMLVVFLICGLLSPAVQAAKPSWRTASASELQSLLPVRAPVLQERIETEMRTASGMINDRGQYVAGVVLITAGYSADGKYTHFFVTQSPIKLGDIQLQPGNYLFGYTHEEDGLLVKVYEAASGKLLGEIQANLNPAITRVESFRIWLPSERGLLQIGRFTFPYQLP